MRRDTTQRIAKTVYYILAGVVLFLILFPIYWIILLAFKPPPLNFTNPPTFIFMPVLDHFVYTYLDPGQNIPNLIASIVEASGATLLAMAVSIPAAYSFSRFDWRGRKMLQFWYLSLLLAPPVVYLIPFYILFYRFGLVDTYQGIILIYQTFAIPYLVWLYKSFIDEIPTALDEAAMVDGASYLTILVRVILPVTAPGLVVSSLFVFVFSWNNLIYALVLASSPHIKPLPVGTFEYFTWTGVTWNYIATNTVVTILPPLIIFLLVKKHIVKGLTFGAVKA